jgi:hypothetical protein
MIRQEVCGCSFEHLLIDARNENFLHSTPDLKEPSHQNRRFRSVKVSYSGFVPSTEDAVSAHFCSFLAGACYALQTVLGRRD